MSTRKNELCVLFLSGGREGSSVQGVLPENVEY